MQTMAKTPLAALIALLLLASCGPLVGAGVAVGADEFAVDAVGGMGCFEREINAKAQFSIIRKVSFLHNQL